MTSANAMNIACKWHGSSMLLERRSQYLRGNMLTSRPLVLRSPCSQVASFSLYSTVETPKKLPTPPDKTSIASLVPWLAQLAMGETKHLWRIALSMSLMVISKVSGLLCPFFVKQVVDALAAGNNQNALFLPHVQWATPIGSSLGIPVSLQAACFAVLCFGAADMVKNVSKELQMPVFLPVTQAVGRRVSFHTFMHMLYLDVRYHIEKRTGRISRVLERGPRAIHQIYRAVIFIFLPVMVELVAVTYLLSKAFSPVVGCVIGTTFLAYCAWSIILTQLSTEARRDVNEADNLVTSKAVDALLNFETVTLFNNQKLEVNQYCKLFQDFQTATNRTELLAALLNGGQAVILALGMCGAMLSAVILGRGGLGATPGDLVMIQGLLLQLWAPLQFLGWLYRELKNSLVDVEEFLDILRTKSNVVDGTEPLRLTPLARQDSHVAASSSRGLEIDLDNVHFGYSSSRKILNGVSIKVHPGQSIAIVGPSGSGKSTLLKLLTRQYDVDHGSSVKLNGQDVRELQLDSLRQSIAVVPQDTVLFNETIMQNIRYGRPDATDAEVMAAARLARLDEAVAKMPKQYETLVGERGLKLSGGEKQRVAIARAFLREPRLLICDEATSALDSESEAKIIESLDELAVGRTSIFVAHRLSTIRGCDRIIVLKDGVLVEEGTHAQLLSVENGLFKQMWEQQVAEDGSKKRPASTASSMDSDSDSETMTINRQDQQLLSLLN